MTTGPSKIPLNVIPLIAPDKLKAPEQRGQWMRAAVLQVITDLVIERVRPEERLPFFEPARELLTQAGRSPVEMLDAVEPGPDQDALFEELGLQREAGD